MTGKGGRHQDQKENKQLCVYFWDSGGVTVLVVLGLGMIVFFF